MIGDLVQDNFASAKGIESLQGNGGYHGADKRSPHGLVGEIVAQLLQTEEHATNGRAKSDTDTTCSSSRKHLTLASLISIDTGEKLHENVGAAAGYVDEWAFFSQPHARGDSKAKTNRFDSQSPCSQEAPDDEATEDGLDFWNTRLFCVRREAYDKKGGEGSEKDLEGGSVWHSGMLE